VVDDALPDCEEHITRLIVGYDQSCFILREEFRTLDTALFDHLGALHLRGR